MEYSFIFAVFYVVIIPRNCAGVYKVNGRRTPLTHVNFGVTLALFLFPLGLEGLSAPVRSIQFLLFFD